jgi:NAD-dependent SIR2 family protein deacetylase
MTETKKWVPEVDTNWDGFDELASMLASVRVVGLTGAGCSTESGIPDYRGPKASNQSPTPIRYGDFIHDSNARRRYWGRSMIGWPRFQQSEPNRAHRALAEMESAGIIEGLITQNVDTLHEKAGTTSIVKLHGSLDEVACLDCGAVYARDRIQEVLEQMNPDWHRERVELAPDGDAKIPEKVPGSFEWPSCFDCGGMLKPNVVFFGENVVDETLQRAWELFDRADALLVVGSSLQVYSSYRFIRRADQKRIPVGIVNLGETRGDKEAVVKVEGKAGDVCQKLLGVLR